MNISQLENHIVNQLTIKRIESDIARAGGQWLPLSKWQADGFDIAMIEKNCDSTKRWSNSFGCWTYRPLIEESWHETVEKALAHQSCASRLFDLCSQALSLAVKIAYCI